MTTLFVLALASSLCLTLLACFIRHNPLLWTAMAVAWGMLLRTAIVSMRAYFGA
ncbi:hypothetical protein [Paraburkholderia bannensis]|uniref:hypothetical protein n=1 Tax=Paraburkholderia bannensis TaxID=765414 RepID=UPI002ABD3945|nr:hypothetical protein [Paraburkholderia bannensis]